MKLTATFSLLAAAIMAGSVSAQSDDSFDAIITAIASIDPTAGGPDPLAYPSQPVEAVEVVAKLSGDGDLVKSTDAFDVEHFQAESNDGSSDVTLVGESAPVARSLYSNGINKGSIARREIPPVSVAADRYEQVFGSNNDLYAAKGFHDASIQGPFYLTYTVVSNGTAPAQYSAAKEACFTRCDKTKGCTFVNIFNEKNNRLLDEVFSEKSDLKCALYGDVFTEGQKTNYGGQQLKENAPLTAIYNSFGFRKPAVGGPVAGPFDVPGYNRTELVGAVRDNLLPAGSGNIGSSMLTQYSPQKCADACNQKAGCNYFNIWRAEVKGAPRSYSCVLYGATPASGTDRNYGQWIEGGTVKLSVTQSRGYAKQAVPV
ncbi:uncharacterized protein PSFLO_07406 [Pseudozyma flocculosa]|nr:uncharacterized protein PSFLO_07406 [Pseudozyma flocculosa]